MRKIKFPYFLKPQRINVIVTLIILVLPILQERVSLEQGGFVVERYSPIFMTVTYVWLRGWYELLLMLGFSLFVYVVTSLLNALLTKKFKFSKSSS